MITAVAASGSWLAGNPLYCVVHCFDTKTRRSFPVNLDVKNGEFYCGQTRIHSVGQLADWMSSHDGTLSCTLAEPQDKEFTPGTTVSVCLGGTFTAETPGWAD